MPSPAVSMLSRPTRVFLRTKSSPSYQPSAPPQPIAPTSVAPPPPPPYPILMCSFHLTDTQDCDFNYDNNLYGVVKMCDDDKNVISQTIKGDDHPIG